MLTEINHLTDTAELLFSQNEIETAIDNLAKQINSVLHDKNPLLLCVMNGGIVLTGKLLTQLNFPLTLDSINASRYRNQTNGGDIDWIQTPRIPLQNKTVLIIDDILDEGLTLQAIYQYCQQHGATAIYSAVLLDKNLGCDKPITADFVGLRCENRYVFGYGMDYKGYCRNSAGIYACKEST